MYLRDDRVGDIWLTLLHHLLNDGNLVSPRGLECREIIGVTLELTDARNNLFAHEHRKLSYRFGIAEWLWIWYGYEDVATIGRFNSNIAQFSDDGRMFAGAYGPRIRRLWDDRIAMLRRDPHTRQAVIPVYTPPAAPTKDVPCTLTFQLLARGGRLHALVAMRSSDVWLGLPYDIFNFSMLLNIAAMELNLEVGYLKMFLGSSHLYERDVERARAVRWTEMEYLRSPALTTRPPELLDTALRTGKYPALRKPFDGYTALEPPWSTYGYVLASANNVEALHHLEALSAAQ